MQNAEYVPQPFARQLILDELFDLTLYQRLKEVSGPELHPTLDELIKVESGHFAFWQELFKIKISSLNPARRMKLQMILVICRLFGVPAIDLILEAIEVHGIRKYLALWRENKDNPIGKAVHGVLEDEFKHEDLIVSRLKGRIINPDRIRNVFLGLNDGMVEILGAVSGFFASFGSTSMVLVAGLTTAVAGSLSMGAGIYVAVSSENEIRRTETEKAQFLGERRENPYQAEPAFFSAIIVAVSYFIGASFPMLPVIFGAKSALPSILTAGTVILLISMLLSFLSGMKVRQRALTNLVIIAVAAGVTYLIGLLVRNSLGIQI
jgi:VIT1/CCC1 family predicted Fe2+/Mn2+ transporter